MNEIHPCESVAQNALDCARTTGAIACEVMVEHRRTRVLNWDRRKAGAGESLEPKDRIVASVRVYMSGGRCGAASGVASSENAVRKLVTVASERCKGADPSNERIGPADRYPQQDKGLGLFDRRHPQLTDEARRSVIRENIEGVQAVTGAEPVSFHYTEELIHRRVINSLGVDQHERSTNYTLTGQVQCGEHTIEQSVHSRHFADVASLPLGADMANQVVRYRDPQEHPSGATVVVIEPRVVAKLMAAIVPAFDRRLVEEGKSFLNQGQRIGSEKLHMVDDALQFGGLQTRSFDDRGVPALDLPLIREGVVGALYMTVEDARVHDARPSGHEKVDGLWTGNLLLRSGTRSRNMMFPELGDFIILDELVVGQTGWFSIRKGTVDLTGHYFSSESGSEPKYIGVRTVRTKFKDLWSGIQEVGNDQQRFGSVDVSTWVVDGLSLV